MFLAAAFSRGIGGVGAAPQDDENAAHRGHFIMVGVIHEGAVLFQGELVLAGFSGRDRGLAEPADSAHPAGQK